MLQTQWIRLQSIGYRMTQSMRSNSARGEGLPAQVGSSNFHTRIQGLYEHSDGPNIELDYIRLAREWNGTEIVNAHTDVIETNEQISKMGHKAPQILAVQNGTQISLQSRKDIFHNKWLDIYNIMEAHIRDEEYLKLSQEWEIMESGVGDHGKQGRRTGGGYRKHTNGTDCA